MKPTTVYLGKQALINTMAVGWGFQSGVRPYQRTFEVHADDGESLANAIGNEIELTIDPGNDQPTLNVKKLWVLGEVPPSRPFYRAFLISDLRWKWQRIHVYRTFNQPRKTGDRRLIGGLPTQIDQGLDTLKYVDFSMKNGKTPWTARDVLEDIAERVCGKKDIKDPKKDPYKIDLAGAMLDLPIQGVTLDDPGDAALLVAMRLMPGVDLYVDANGVTHFYNASQVELTDTVMSKKTEREVDGTRHSVRSEMRRIRPSKVTVLFTPEVELRFDAVTEQDSSDATVVNPDERLMMENVVPIPDDRLTVSGKVLTRGTYITFAQAFAAWNSDLPSGAEALSFDRVRALWIRGDALEACYANLGALAPTANWVARVGSIRAHFRQTYRINPRWMRRIRVLNPYRLGMYDPVTGVRAPAVAMMDYAVHCSAQGLAAQGPDQQYTVLNVTGYPGENGNPDSDGKIAPAVVSILDHDQGIIHLEMRRDTVGTFQTVYPSKLVNENGTEAAFTLNTSRWRFDPIGADLKVKGTSTFASLSSSHRVCVILSAIPAYPNNERALYGIELNPDRVSKHFTGSKKAAQGGEGPEWTLRFGPQLTARIMWVQSQESIYGRIFGVGGSGVASGAGILGTDIPASIMQNRSTLDEAAEALAASLWAGLLTKTEGTARLHMEINSSEDHPQGNITLVEHRVEAGRLITEWTASPTIFDVAPSAFLSVPARLAIFGIIPSGGK